PPPTDPPGTARSRTLTMGPSRRASSDESAGARLVPLPTDHASAILGTDEAGPERLNLFAEDAPDDPPAYRPESPVDPPASRRGHPGDDPAPGPRQQPPQPRQGRRDDRRRGGEPRHSGDRRGGAGGGRGVEGAGLSPLHRRGDG